MCSMLLKCPQSFGHKVLIKCEEMIMYNKSIYVYILQMHIIYSFRIFTVHDITLYHVVSQNII